MDGSNPKNLVSAGSGFPWGITIDFKTSRLLWTDYNAEIIDGSNLEGGDRRTVLALSQGTYPSGIAVGNDKIYWGGLSRKVQSCTMDGNNVTTLHTDTKVITGMTLIPDLNRPQQQHRANHCAGHSCSKVCVLTSTSSRCLT